ncbi:hypothetical protein GCM10010371_58010 [Streptomyces subrutilus]|uniref:Uncharacterized protein n=1 Tax=Streptomyces subrutilus TaxID=36818 RepID=A0A918RB64_9ACTN|nr:hypothetical protein [Streptomyces subrutilus]GGZ90466.1 hypothetical protein GCM10010371_58010 [Streptomyces subrutilus]
MYSARSPAAGVASYSVVSSVGGVLHQRAADAAPAVAGRGVADGGEAADPAAVEGHVRARVAVRVRGAAAERLLVVLLGREHLAQGRVHRDLAHGEARGVDGHLEDGGGGEGAVQGLDGAGVLGAGRAVDDAVGGAGCGGHEIHGTQKIPRSNWLGQWTDGGAERAYIDWFTTSLE